MTRLRRALGAARALIPDAIVLAGLLLVSYGAGLYSPPLAFIIAGAGLIIAVGLGSRS
jgi:hypothetical protein